MVENTTNEKNDIENSELIDEWMIKDCAWYDEEYSDCTSIKARFHQLFVFGKLTDCTSWKRDSKNCYKWRKTKDTTAAEELIKSEKNRRLTRLLAHYANDVWTKREQPPENWNCPLPEFMEKQYEGTYLQIKSKEFKGEVLTPVESALTSSCTIL